MEQDNELAVPGVSLQEYLAILRRRSAIILQAFVLITVVGVVVTLMTKPVYDASAQMVVDAPSTNVNTVNATNPLSQLLALTPEQSVDTQIQLLQARPLISQVYREVGPASFSISTVGEDTNIIEVDSQAATPQVAADAANRLLQLYIAQDADQNLSELQSAVQFVQTQDAQAQKSLTAAENSLEQFEAQHHIADLTADKSEVMSRVASLQGGISTDTTSLAALDAQIAEIHSLQAAEPQSLMQRAAATNTEIASLKDQIRQLEVQKTGMTQPGGYTDLAPPVRAIDAQIDTLRAKLAAQPALMPSETVSPNALRQSLHGQVVTLDAQRASLLATIASARSQMTQAQAQLAQYPDYELALGRLTAARDGAAAQENMFSSKLADLTLREKARHEDARIIQTALPPLDPIRPKKAESVLFSALIGLFVGLCLALLQEFLDDRINTPEDADRALALPALGVVPVLTAADAKLLPQMKGMDPAAESYRVLRTNLHFASVDAPVRTLLVTSSAPGEGKTTTAANLAFAMAADGRKVILVDTDLRRPSLHKLLDISARPGLTDVLLGDVALEQALMVHDQIPELMVLPSGPTPPNPSELLGSRTFRNLVGDLSDRADIVIFDSPPALAGADAMILASQMDGTVLVVETGHTKKAAARRALGLLRQARATVLGTAYNKTRQGALGGYFYEYYHYAHKPEETEVPAVKAARLLPDATDAKGDTE